MSCTEPVRADAAEADALPSPHLCPICHAPARSPRALYCSAECRKRAELDRRESRRQPRVCAECGAPVPHGRRKFCSERCGRKHYHATHPETRAAIRERCRRWAEEHRNVRNRQPWLLGQPPYVGRLPGGTSLLDLAPAPKWPVDLRSSRALHGVLTRLVGKPHVDHRPAWALQPCSDSPCGWAVHWLDPDALRLAGQAHAVSIFNEDRALYISDARSVPSPQITRRGRRLVRLDTITPITIQAEGRTTYRLAPEANHLRAALRIIPPRIGLSVPDDDVRLELVSREYEAEAIECGGKFGTVRGWVGTVVVECNAVAHWLLEVAQTTGLGGRCAFGFGAVHVTEVER